MGSFIDLQFSNSTRLRHNCLDATREKTWTYIYKYIRYIELTCTANPPAEMYTITCLLANEISFRVPIYTNFLIH